MKRKQRHLYLCILLSLLLVISCGKISDSSGIPANEFESVNGQTMAPSSFPDSNASSGGTTTSSVPVTIAPIKLPEETTSGTTADSDTTIKLTGNTAEVNGAGASVDSNTITITKSGTYELTGTLDDGQIIVNTSDEKKVTLILNGANIFCSYSSPVYVISSPKKTVLYLQENSVNVLEDGAEYILSSDPEADNPSAVIYSKDDLAFDGTGTLYVSGNYCKGIFSKDDLDIEDGVINVTAVDDGIRGKDSVVMTGGTVTISAGGDGLRTSNETDAEKGYIAIDGGSLSIDATLDAIQAITDLTISNGTISVISGGGSANSSDKASSGWGDWGGPGGGMPGGMKQDGGMQGGMKQDGMVPRSRDNGEMSGVFSSTVSDFTTETTSAKGLKAGNSITISGGTISIDSSDDAIHSNNLAELCNGVITIASGDDGIHANTKLVIAGGTLTITKSYEGIESTDISISGGICRITASDDGLNAAGGVDASATTDRTTKRGMGMFSSSTGTASLSGGYCIINSTGDGIDVNGGLSMTGGTFIVYGPTNNGNGALDYDGSFTVSGGTILAMGSSGMAQSVTSTKQGVLAFTISLPAETLIHVEDDKGNEILTVASPKTSSCIVLCSPKLVSGSSYTIFTGGSYSIDSVDGIYSGGTYSGGTSLGTLTAS